MKGTEKNKTTEIVTNSLGLLSLFGQSPSTALNVSPPHVEEKMGQVRRQRPTHRLSLPMLPFGTEQVRAEISGQCREDIFPLASPAESQDYQQHSPTYSPTIPVSMNMKWTPTDVRQTKRRCVAVRDTSDTIVQKLTVSLPKTFNSVNPNFKYTEKQNPRRALTKPSQAAGNNGFDNVNNDYVLYVNDYLGENQKYMICDLLGQGTFGQVVKCYNLKSKEEVAIKVIKNKEAYYNQSVTELRVLNEINNHFDKNDNRHIIRMKESFVFRKHLCIVFELLSINLYERIKQKQFRGLNLTEIRTYSQQILEAMICMTEAGVIHCDLKPENILLMKKDSIKVIDFGSACTDVYTPFTYVQSRFYRAPEVILGLPYTNRIDMWSFGCIVAELYLGLPIFPGVSEYDQISKICAMLGNPPQHMLEAGKSTRRFFNKKTKYQLKSPQEQDKPNKLNPATSLRDCILAHTADLTFRSEDKECLIDFLNSILVINSVERCSPQQAKLHPFITGANYSLQRRRSSIADLTASVRVRREKDPRKLRSKSSLIPGGFDSDFDDLVRAEEGRKNKLY